MEQRLFIGVDGGGSRTRARLRDESGAMLGEAEAGPGNARLGGGREQIMLACRRALSEAGLGEEAMRRVHAGFGLAGTQQDHDRQAVLDQPHPFASLSVDTDAYVAWLGAFGGEDGAILILGTGSCGLAIIEGARLNVGGWGFDIGDDGSGAALGRMAVSKAVLALEGMAERTDFADSVLADFGHEAQNATLWAADATPGDFAAYVPRVFDFAERGDELAVEIVRTGAEGAMMLARRLVQMGAGSIAMIGGLYQRVLPWFDDDVRSVLRQPAADGADGGVLMARRAQDGIGTGR